jgi:hypothetical protein
MVLISLSSEYALIDQSLEGSQISIVPLTNAWIVAAGMANWFGENSSLLASQRYTRCAWTCLNSHLDM